MDPCTIGFRTVITILVVINAGQAPTIYDHPWIDGTKRVCIEFDDDADFNILKTSKLLCDPSSFFATDADDPASSAWQHIFTLVG